MNFSEQRKAEQLIGECPEWFTTAGYQVFKKNYAYKDETVKSRFSSIAKGCALYAPSTYPEWWEDDPYTKGLTWEQAFFKVLWLAHVVPPTPLYANGGVPERGHTVSCSQVYMGNNLYDRHNMLTELAILTKHAAGTSVSLDEWPAKGDLLKRGGRSEGVLPIIQDIVKVMNETAQTTRRGSCAYSLSVRHGDFEDVLANVYANPESNNVGWLYDDKEIQDCWVDKKPEAVSRFAKTLAVKLPRGKGYYTKIDHMNRHLAEPFKLAGLNANSSQLCVAPETLVLTDKGHVEIELLEGQMISVWNGQEWSEVEVVKTGENQKLVTVSLSSGQSLDCTEYHKWYVQTKEGVVCKRTFELKEGDWLIKWDAPLIEGSRTLDYAYDNGFFTADGTNSNGAAVIYLYHGKRKLADKFSSVKSWTHNEELNRSVSRGCIGLQDKYFVPDATYTIDSRLQWLAGYLDGDGCVARNGDNQSLQMSSTNPAFLRDLQNMLLTIGVHSKIVIACEEREQLMPLNDGSGENGLFRCKKAERLLITSNGLRALYDLGLRCHRLIFDGRVPYRNGSRYLQVVEVADKGRYDDTYCFKEHKRGMGVFNGILTGQCQEIVLPSTKDYTYSCVLMNYNLAKWNEWKDSPVVFIGQVMSDCNVSAYLAALDNVSEEDKKALAKIKRFTEEFRALGSGVMGLATLFQQERIAWDSLDAFYLNGKIFKHLDKQSLEASQWLAKVVGEPLGCKGLGIRNATRLSMPPTKSTAELCYGVSEGINPDVAHVFTKQTASGEVFRVTPEFLKLMKERGKYNQEELARINKAKGSVQGCDWLTEHEKNVFRTAFEINMKVVLNLAEQRQHNIDQAQSLNLYFASNATNQYIADVHKQFFLSDKLMTLYYIYGSRGDGVYADIVECSMCQ